MLRGLARVSLPWLLLVTAVTPGFSWWDKGHILITEMASERLPGDLPAFLAERKASLCYFSTSPDNWRQGGDALRLAEAPNHFLDIESIPELACTIYQFPDRYSAILAFWARGDSVQNVGLLPYQILECYERLVVEFRRYRAAKGDTMGCEDAVIASAGLMAHYVGDVTQPLHTTIHYNGRRDDEGRVVSQKGIHARFEGRFVQDYISREDCLRYVGQVRVSPDPKAEVTAAIMDSHRLVDEVYRLDREGKLAGPDEEAISFVARQLGEGARLLGTLWATAWAESGR